MSALILGIDPGVSGALAFYDPTMPLDSPKAAILIDMPTLHAKRGKNAMDVDTAALVTLINFATDNYGPIKSAAVEQVHSRPRQAGQFAFGCNYGRVLGCLESLFIPVQHIAPSKWKQALGLRGEDKMQSVKLAAALFPGLAPQLFGPRGAGLDGRAEALLIAYYGAHHA